MKSTISICIDSDVLTRIRATGENISQICELALAEAVHFHKTKPQLFDSMPEDDIKFFNMMIHKCAEIFPGYCKKWSEMVFTKYNFKIDYYDLHKLCKELINE